MVKYLGSKITLLSAFVVPVFICLPLLFGVSALHAETSTGTVLLFIMCVLCSVIFMIYMKTIENQLYSWGKFTNDKVEVMTGLRHTATLTYKNCQGCGIGYYTHGLLNSKAGPKIYFIFLSNNRFDEKFRAEINLWKPSNTQIKAEFSKKLYTYLLETLPKSQSKALEKDYEKYFGQS